MTQLDFLGETLVIEEKPVAEKKVKRPARHYPASQAQKAVREELLPKLPDSLLAPFIEGAAIAEEEALEKAPGAFKNISEAAKLLDVPQHVLRFWESRFSQIKPLKLNGGRRYYRPEDIDILTTIKHLLYKQGYTIKGAKKAFSAGKHIVPAPEPVIPTVPTVDKNLAQLSLIRRELMELRDSLINVLIK